ncbi:MAG: hypothetical protein KDD94_08205, partial [Calditrichaeota bacterium]|nr:hypothetical protein [Calditrichota bacterium]
MPKLCLVFISISLNLLSQNIVLTDSTQKSALRDQLKLFVDSGKEYTIDELVNQSSLFKKIDTQKLLFGYTDSAIWLYLRITNQSTKNWVLSLPRPSLRYVDFYRIDSNRITHTETGFYRPFHQRDYNFVDFAFPVKQNI